MMRSELLLHSDAVGRIDRLIDQPPHAVLLSGSQGSGKSHLAQAVATELLGSDVTSGNSPYYREIIPSKGAISIEQIRQLIQFFQLQVPGRNRVKRVAVVIDADMMGIEAQNALLKLLEEPPEGSVLLLTSSRQLGLLPTVRSRLQLLTIPDPAHEQIIEYLQRTGHDASAAERAVLRHGANIAAITKTLSGETSEMTGGLESVKMALAGNQFERLLLVDPLSKQKDQAIGFADTLATVAAASITTAASKGTSVSRWQAVLEAANTAQEALEHNGNTKLVLTELMLSL